MTIKECDGRCPLCNEREECRVESIRIGNLAEALSQDTWEDDSPYPEDDDDFDDDYFDDRERAWIDDKEDNDPYTERGQLDSDLGNER
jgi:hypothetical protein